jgi:AcrR family transcriptional regulator
MTRRARTTNAERPTVEERRAAKRQEILDAAVRAIRTDGASVSMSRIASEAGTSKPIVYRHFRDKEGLYQALAERYVQRLIERLRSALVSDTDPRQLVVATIDAYLGFLEEEAQVHRFLAQRMLPYREDGQPVLAHFQAQVARELTVVLRDQLKTHGHDTGAADPWAFALVGMATSAGDWWIDHPEVTRPHLVEYLSTLVWEGFAGVVSRTRWEPSSALLSGARGSDEAWKGPAT